MNVYRLGRLALAAWLCLAAAGDVHAARDPLPRVALFPLDLLDSSLEGELAGADPDEASRLALLDRELRARIERSGRLELAVPVGPARAGCRACVADAAAAAGADYALTGWVQKVSDLILNINLRVTDARTGAVVFQDSVDIRGNTDESWLHGLRHLVDRRLLAPPR
ncbi:MAG TPA: DUF3280 domain-containing protein [Geminicoccaceae bacterium]